MRTIRPKLVAPQVTIAEDQEEFLTVVGAFVRHPGYKAIAVRERSGAPLIGVNTVVLCFRPSDDERKRLAEGADLYLAMLTVNIPGVNLFVGPEEPAQLYGMEVER